MNPLRLMIVTRHFWPVIEPAGVRLANLAESLRGEGLHVQILTSQWDRDWSRQLSYREVPVTRVPRPAQGSWRLARYSRALEKELLEQASGWEAVLVAGSADEIEAAVQAREHGGPQQVLVRADESLRLAMLQSKGSANKFSRWLPRADLLICPQSFLREFYQQFFSGPIIVIPDGLHLAESRPANRHEKIALREAISELHPLLHISPNNVLGATIGGFDEAATVEAVLGAWQQLTQPRSQPRLWMIGDGAGALGIWQQINHFGLTVAVSLPGSFDHLEDPLQAADFFLHPWGKHAGPWGVAEAMACGLPIVYSREAEHLEGLVDGKTGLAFIHQNPHDLAEKIAALQEDVGLKNRLGQAARQFANEHYALDRIAEDWAKRLADVCAHPGVSP
jgi:glycosyltransferase involved in cell wall biosynthesis